jgi:hypothetical protein
MATQGVAARLIEVAPLELSSAHLIALEREIVDDCSTTGGTDYRELVASQLRLTDRAMAQGGASRRTSGQNDLGSFCALLGKVLGAWPTPESIRDESLPG